MGIVSTLGRGLVTFLHVLEHLSALGIAHGVGGATEVCGEEGTEGWDAWSSWCSVTWDGLGVGWSEEVGGVDLESLEVGVSKLTHRDASSSLEWMSSHKGGMGVI